MSAHPVQNWLTARACRLPTSHRKPTLPDGSLDPTFGEGREASFTIPAGPDWHPSGGGRGCRCTDTEVTAFALAPDEPRLFVSGTWSNYPAQGFVARVWN
jgi:hypothetical protein